MRTEPEQPEAPVEETAEVEGAAAERAAAEPAAAPPAPAADGVRFTDRVFALGMTQSGKSELLNHLASAMRVQRVLIDTKDEWTLPDVEPVSDPDAIDWQQPIVHYVDASGRPGEFDRLFRACYGRRNLVVIAHELGDLCEFRPNQTPPGVIRYLNKGAARGLGFLGGSQRPVMVPSHARTEATHFFLFVPRLNAGDLQDVAKEMGMTHDALAAELDQLHAELGDHAFLWWSRRSRELVACEPLAEHVRAATVIGRKSAPSGLG